MSDDRRYQPPHLTVKLEERNDEAPLLFRKVNVELTPQPRPMRFVISSRGGDLTCDYDPAPLIGEVIHDYAWLLCPPVTVISEFTEMLGSGDEDAERYLAELYCDRLRMCVGTACNYARAQIERYLLNTLDAVHDDAVNHTYAARNNEAFKVEPVEALIRDGMKEHRKRLRESVNLPTRGGKRRFYYDWTDEQCIKFARNYEDLLHELRRVKAAYKKDPKNYLDKVDTLFLPERAVERLTDLDAYKSLPSNVALLTAAEELGVEAGKYQPESLRPYLARGRKLIKSGAGSRDFWDVKVWV